MFQGSSTSLYLRRPILRAAMSVRSLRELGKLYNTISCMSYFSFLPTRNRNETGRLIFCPQGQAGRYAQLLLQLECQALNIRKYIQIKVKRAKPIMTGTRSIGDA